MGMNMVRYFSNFINGNGKYLHEQFLWIKRDFFPLCVSFAYAADNFKSAGKFSSDERSRIYMHK